MYASKLSQLLKRSDPSRDVYVFYTDLRAFGKGFEEYYKRGQEAGVKFVRGRPAEFFENPVTKKVTVKVEDTLSRKLIESEFDLVVLSVGMVPNPGTAKIAEMLRVTKSPDGFLQEAHPKFRPVDTLTEGVFLAGTVQGPKDIPDTVAQASAAAARAIRLMNQGEYALSPVVAFVDEAACDGCGACVEACPVDAIRIADDLASVGEAACTGCGACLASCPRDAIDLRGYTTGQLEAEVEAALRGSEPGSVVIVFADDMTGYRLADNVGTSRIHYSTDSRIIGVPSGSRVTPGLMLKTLALGAGGVLIADSEEKSTPYAGSTAAMRANVAEAQRVLKEEGIESERVRSVEFVTVMLANFAGQINEMCALAGSLGPISSERRDSLKNRVDGAVPVDQI